MTSIRDIAQKLNVSVSAVSHALNGYPDISDDTRRQVIEAARELGYTPNQAARQLRRNKADAIGYILPADQPRFADPYFSEFIAGLGDEAARHESGVLISTAPPGQDAEQHLYQSWVQSHKVDGLILNHIHLHDWRIQYLVGKHFPFVSLENCLDEIDFPYIEVDSQSGMVELVNHLVEQGYRKIAYITGPEFLKLQYDRLEGYRKGLEANQLVYRQELVIESDMTSPGGYQSTKRLISIPDPPDAIISINDETAFGAMRAAREMGYTIGKDLAVAGFDGVYDARHTEPPLTTLDLPVYEIARQLVQMLFAEIAGQPLPKRRIVLKPTLLKRASTGGNRA